MHLSSEDGWQSEIIVNNNSVMDQSYIAQHRIQLFIYQVSYASNCCIFIINEDLICEAYTVKHEKICFSYILFLWL